MVVKDEILNCLNGIIINNKNVFIMAEHPIVALARLNELKGSDLSGLPFILLLLDIKESFTPNNIDVSVNFVIGTVTNQPFTTDERYATNFTPILYPIFEQLITKLQNGSNTIHSTSYLEFEKYDRVLWGKEGLYGVTGNIFEDYIDAIEINNLKLLITKTNC
jgi:hypothetical protein